MNVGTQEEMIINGIGQYCPELDDSIAQGLIYGFYDKFAKVLDDKFDSILVIMHSQSYSDALPYIEVTRKQKIKTAMRSSDTVVINIMHDANTVTASCTAEPGYTERIYSAGLLNPDCIEELVEQTLTFINNNL
tara:strand:- start:12 stop:413 length:402 start_codon:yes stop_codon:yes gene_type:complete